MVRTAKKDSITIRRNDAFPYFVGGLFAVGMSAAVLVNSPLNEGEVSVYLACAGLVVAMSYIGGPAAHVRVTDSRVVVANTLRVRVIPRGLIESIGDYQNLHVKITLMTGVTVRVGAFEPGLYVAGSRSFRAYLRRGRELERVLERVPIQDSGDGTYQWRLRYSNLAIMVLTVALLLFAIFWGLPRA